MAISLGYFTHDEWVDALDRRDYLPPPPSIEPLPPLEKPCCKDGKEFRRVRDGYGKLCCPWEIKRSWEILGYTSLQDCIWDTVGFGYDTGASTVTSIAGGVLAKKKGVFLIAKKFPPTLIATGVGWLGRIGIGTSVCNKTVCN